MTDAGPMSRLRQPPSFWWREAPRRREAIAAAVLSPLGHLYGEIAARRMRQKGFRSSLPVLCVGNLTVGGAGKTPTALALARRLIAQGEKPWFLSRGYRSAAERGPPVLVDLAAHQAKDVGDEALLLARVAPTVVSADRVASARLAATLGASLLILDDSLQNPALEKDLRLIVVDAGAGIGNGLCLPAGPLRAPLPAQLAFSDALLIIGSGAPGQSLAKAAEALGKPVFWADLSVPQETAEALAHRRVQAFAGIGRPDKFFASLAEAGAEIVGSAAFPDHYAYRRKNIARLQQAAGAAQAQLMTTEKDLVRLQPWAALVDPNLPQPEAVPVELRIRDPAGFDELVAQALQSARGRL